MRRLQCGYPHKIMMMHHAKFTEICGFGCCCFLNAFPFFFFFFTSQKRCLRCVCVCACVPACVCMCVCEMCVWCVCVCVMCGKTEANVRLCGRVILSVWSKEMLIRGCMLWAWGGLNWETGCILYVHCVCMCGVCVVCVCVWCVARRKQMGDCWESYFECMV